MFLNIMNINDLNKKGHEFRVLPIFFSKIICISVRRKQIIFFFLLPFLQLIPYVRSE